MNSILMCPPTYYEVRYAINPWMEQSGSGSVDHSRAQLQWQSLVARVRECRPVSVIEAEPEAPDMCFTANAGLVRGSHFVRSNFLHDERRVEERPFARWFSEHGFTCHVLPRDVCFEGAGDALFDVNAERLWMGHGMRTDLAAAGLVEELLGVKVTPLRLIDPRFYHLDTCFCPLANGTLVYYPAAFDAASIERIEAAFDCASRIAIDEQDALHFACNMIDLGDSVLVTNASEALQRSLATHGVRVGVIELDEFIKAGGGAKCMALPIDDPGSIA